MALFNLPLHKRGNRKCPDCGSPVEGTLMDRAFSRWTCTQCGAELGIDLGRCILGWLLGTTLVGLGLVCTFSGTLLPWGWAVTPCLVSSVSMFVFTEWWLASVRRLKKVSLEQTGWRNPPLHKAGNKHCPNCGSPVGWTSLWWRQSSQGDCTSVCPNCGSALTLDVGRYLLGWVPPAAFFAVWWLWIASSETADTPLPGWSGAPFVFGGALLFMFAQWWFASVRFQEPIARRPGWRHPAIHRPGNKHCPKCGTLVRRTSKTPLWSKWDCIQCGTALRHDSRRLVVGLFAFTGSLAALLCTFVAGLVGAVSGDGFQLPGWYVFLCIPGFYLLTVFFNWWCVSVRLSEKSALGPSST